MNSFFTKTKRKIALIFALSASALILAATLLTIVLIRFQMDFRSKNILESNINELRSQYGVVALDEKSVRFQYDTSKQSSILDSRNSQYEEYPPTQTDETDSQKDEEVNKEELPNVITQKNLDVKKHTAENLEDIKALQENKNVYTRVIDSDGYVLYSSDLFTNFTIDFKRQGFLKTETMYTCIYSYTSKIESGEFTGTTLQTGQFCQITPRQQLEIGFIMLAITFISSILAYILGLITAQFLLKPLKNSVDQTKDFTQNAYHELLTPISVALSTAESAIATKKYEKGIKSLVEDLRDARKSLQFLGIRALQQKGNLETEIINLEELITSNFNELLIKLDREDIKTSLDLKPKLKVEANHKAVEIIINNLLSNALKYTDKNGTISISSTDNTIQFENTINKKSRVDPKKFFEKYYRSDHNTLGNGLGLNITKSLIDDLGWEIRALRKEYNNKKDVIIIYINY